MSTRLTHLMNNRVVIARRVATTGDRLAYVTTTAEMMNIQPFADSVSEIREGVFGKQFRAFADGGANIVQGDRFTDELGASYTVMSGGVSRRTMGSIDYLVIAIEKT